jgi:hypothetical protein
MPQFGASEAVLLSAAGAAFLLSSHVEAALSHFSQPSHPISGPASPGSSQPGQMDEFGDNQRMDLIYHESQTAALCGVSLSSGQRHRERRRERHKWS